MPLFKPGQYLTVRLPDPRGQTTMRNYTISNAPGEDAFRISVEHVPNGVVSGFLHTRAKAGTEIEVGPPCGGFFLDLTATRARPLMLLSAGVGITPLLSMLLSVLQAQPERAVFFVHSARNGRVHAFRDLVRQLASRHPHLTVYYRYNDATDEDRNMRWHDSEGLIDAALLLLGLAGFLAIVLFVIIALDRPFSGDMGITADLYQFVIDHYMQR